MFVLYGSQKHASLSIFLKDLASLLNYFYPPEILWDGVTLQMAHCVAEFTRV
jgi:hypothetical protein